MTNLELSIDREIEFMIKYQLTADEFFLMKLIFFAQDGHPEYLDRFFSQNKLGTEIRSLLQTLQEKEIINKTYNIPDKGEIFKPNDVDFNKRITKNLLEHSQDLGLELFENYPSYTIINGKTFSLKNITKLYHSFDEMCWAYGKAVKFNLELHKKVLDLLEYAKDNNLICSGICDFIESRKWLDLEQMQNDDLGTFQTTELL